MDFWNLIPAVRRAREERDEARRSEDRLSAAYGIALTKLDEVTAQNVALTKAADAQTPTGFYVAVFTQSAAAPKGLVSWVGNAGHGLTIDMHTAGVFTHKEAQKIAGNSRAKVVVPAWFVAENLHVRRVVHTADCNNGAMWHPVTLGRAICAAARGRKS